MDRLKRMFIDEEFVQIILWTKRHRKKARHLRRVNRMLNRYLGF